MSEDEKAGLVGVIIVLIGSGLLMTYSGDEQANIDTLGRDEAAKLRGIELTQQLSQLSSYEQLGLAKALFRCSEIFLMHEVLSSEEIDTTSNARDWAALEKEYFNASFRVMSFANEGSTEYGAFLLGEERGRGVGKFQELVEMQDGPGVMMFLSVETKKCLQLPESFMERKMLH